MFQGVLRAANRYRLLSKLPYLGVGAEIGVWRGHYSLLIIERASPRELHLIDPWKFDGSHPSRWYGGKLAKSQADMDAIHEAVEKQFAGKPRVKIHRGTSAEVLPTLPDLDWVYIDGDHSYEAVKLDLELSLKRVRKGGLITGDDLNWGEGLPVRRAVEEFIKEHGLKMRTLGSQFLIRV